MERRAAFTRMMQLSTATGKSERSPPGQARRQMKGKTRKGVRMVMVSVGMVGTQATSFVQ